jgi:outer membrane lipoprotein-sorting protein
MVFSPDENDSEKIDGQKCDHYRAISHQQTGSMKLKNIHHLWVRQADGVVLKAETENEFGHGIMEYKNIKIGVPVSDSLFELPKGYKIEDRTPKSLFQNSPPRH